MNKPIDRESRPWGHMDIYAMNEKCTVKMLTVKPGQSLSLQRHKLRDQLYVILDPIQIHSGPTPTEIRVIDAIPGMAFWFERGHIHRAVNTGSQSARYLEVAYGIYKEKDIERLEDQYGRK